MTAISFAACGLARAVRSLPAVVALALLPLLVLAQTPIVTTLSPASGAIGSSVTITGSGFNATAAQDVVFFGATRATVTAASATNLTVTVPVGATYQYLSVTNLASSKTGYSAKPFGVTLNGLVAFDPKVDFTNAGSPYSVVIGDVDGDGKPDLVMANSSAQVSVLRNTSTAGAVSFAAGVTVSSTSSGNVAVALGDLDGDGKLDLAIAIGNNNTVGVMRNTSTPGTVSFTAVGQYPAGAYPNSVAIGDVDGDGKPDVVVANRDSNTASIFRSTSTVGALNFAAKVDVATSSSPTSVTIGDLDSNGKPDLAVTSSGGAKVSVLRNTSVVGTVGFAGRVDYSTGAGPQSVAIGDVDGDSKLDLVTSNTSSNNVSVLRNTNTTVGTLSFAAKVDYATGAYPYTVAIGDVDGDGKPELAVANYSGGTVSVLRNTSVSGTVGFAAAVDATTGNQPISVAIGDLDGDGKPDLATANNGASPGNGPTSVSVIRQNGIPVITAVGPTSGAIGSSVVITGRDFNATAAQNVVFFGATKATVTVASRTSLTVTVPVGTTYDFPSVTNLATNRTGYAPRPFSATLAGAVAFELKNDITAANQPYSVAYGDVDGDGKPDLAVANYGNASVSVFRNTSTTGVVSFAAKVDYPAGANPWSVAIGDVDGDGKLDLAVANGNSNNVSVLRNTSAAVGTVSFAAKVDFGTGTSPFSVAIGDLDGDGRPELAAANNGAGTVSVLRNLSSSGTVSFGTKVDYTTGLGAYKVVIGDVDGNGQPDLAVANANAGTVSVLRNTSAGGALSFAAKVDAPTGTLPFSLALGDLDGDGKPELATANFGTTTASVIRNTSTSGTVSFAAKVDYTTGTQPFSVAIGDVDGDGLADLAVANRGSNTVSVLRNTSIVGTLGFAAKVDVTTGTQPTSARIGDLDGDGQPDLAVSNYGSNTVSVFRQVSIPVVTAVTPGSGAVGSSVVITGSGFNTTAAQNIVFFGATRATVTVASRTSLTVTVPAGATYDYPTVTNLSSNRTGIAPKPFNVTLNGAVAFKTKVDFATGPAPISLRLTDADGDGKADLVVGNANAITIAVAVYRNTSTAGTVGFAAKVDNVAGYSPRAVSKLVYVANFPKSLGGYCSRKARQVRKAPTAIQALCELCELCANNSIGSVFRWRKNTYTNLETALTR